MKLARICVYDGGYVLMIAIRFPFPLTWSSWRYLLRAKKGAHRAG